MGAANHFLTELLALFLGLKNTDDGWIDKDNLLSDYAYLKEYGNPYGNLYFHYSWDWLMPVAKKFLSLGRNEGLYFKYCDRLEEALASFDSKGVFDVLIEGVSWFNKEV